jgi:hypothetical protein
MVAAPRIKPRPAPRTPRLAIHILPNRHLHPASPAQNRPLLPLPPPPNRNRMPRQRNMAILASPVDPATPHLNRNNIHRRPPVHTPRLRIKSHPPNGSSSALLTHHRQWLSIGVSSLEIESWRYSPSPARDCRSLSTAGSSKGTRQSARITSKRLVK